MTGGTLTGIVIVGIANAYADRASNPLPSNFIAQSSSQRLYMGSYYTSGSGACATIQSSDYYSSTDHGTDLLLNPLGGVVGIGAASPSLNWANTAIPNAKLTILGGVDIGVNGKARISLGADTRHYSAIEAEHIGSGSTTLSLMTCESAFVNGSNPYTRVFIDELGRVGINTITNSSLLTMAKSVTDDNDYNLMISYNNTALSGYLDWQIGPQVIGGTAFFSIRGGADGFGSLSNLFNINGGTGRIGIGTSNPLGLLDIYSTGESYNSSLRVRTNWAGIQLSSSGSGGRSYNLLSSITGAGIGPGSFGIFDETASAYRFSIASDGVSKFHSWFRVDNGDTSTCVYGPNSTWASYLRVGSGTSGFDTNTAQIISTNGNLHLDSGYSKDFYINFYNNSNISLGINYIYGDTQFRNKVTVGLGSSRTLMTISDGSGGSAIGGYFGNIANWPDNANGTLYTPSAPSGANSLGLFVGYSDPAQGGYITCLGPSIAWLNLYIYASTLAVYYTGTLCAYTNAGGWVNVSDEREKEDIRLLKTKKSLDRVMALKPLHYRRKFYDSLNQASDEIKQKRYIGFIAQEVKESNPHCVSTWNNKEVNSEDNGERFGISYNDYIVHLVGAVQELSKSIDALTLSKQEHNKKIELLTNRTSILEIENQELKERISHIENNYNEYKKQTDLKLERIYSLFQL